MVLAAAWDDVQGYRLLADSFAPEITVFALPVTGHTPGDLDTVSVVVDEATRLLSDHLPWPAEMAIVGWSIGGVVAFELGHRLARDDISVTQIGLVDTYFPGEQQHLWSNRWWKYKSMLGGDAFGAAIGELRLAARRRVRRYVARSGRRLLDWAGEPVPKAAATASPGGIPFTAFEHDPAPGPVPVVLYAARTTNPKRTIIPWSRVAPDLRIVPVEGRHRGADSIMGSTRVRQVSADVETALGLDR